MYRAPDAPPLKCPLCASESLTPETLFDPTEGYAQVMFAIKDATPSFFGRNERLRVRVTRTRVCLTCGFVALAVSADAREELKAQMGRLQEIGEADEGA